MDTLILKIYFLIIQINNFQGDISDTSADRQHWYYLHKLDGTFIWTTDESPRASSAPVDTRFIAQGDSINRGPAVHVINLNVVHDNNTQHHCVTSGRSTDVLARCSVAVSTETSLRSPRKIFIFTIKK